VQHQPYVGARKLKIQSFLLSFLKGRLRVVVGYYVPQFAVVLPSAQPHEDFDEFGDLVLVEEEMYFFGADGDVELDGYGLWVYAVGYALPALLVRYEVAGGVARVFA
jgi:hypothetical protein